MRTIPKIKADAPKGNISINEYMRHTRILGAAALWCAAFCAYAQGTVKGLVKDGDGEPVPFSTVVAEGLGRTVSANQYGEYELKDVPAGKHKVRASCLGYNAVTAEVTMAGQDVSCDFALPSLDIALGEAVVAGSDRVKLCLEKLAETPALKKRVKSYKCEAVCKVESLGNLSDMPKSFRKTVNFIMGLLGYKKMWQSMEREPHLIVDVRQGVTYTEGKYKYAGTTLDVQRGTLTGEEQAAYKKKIGEWDNPYDMIYDAIRGMKRNYDKAAENGKETSLKYKGDYEEDGHAVYVITTKSIELHVVPEVWQISRIVSRKKDKYFTAEFRDMGGGVYLPVSASTQDRYTDEESNVNWTWVRTNAYGYSDLQLQGE